MLVQAFVLSGYEKSFTFLPSLERGIMVSLNICSLGLSLFRWAVFFIVIVANHVVAFLGAGEFLVGHSQLSQGSPARGCNV